MSFAWWSMWDAYARRYQPGVRNATRYMVWNLPLYGDWYRMEQGLKDSNDYLKNRGLSWADADRVGNLPGAGGNWLNTSGASLSHSARNFTSKNIYKLYR